MNIVKRKSVVTLMALMLIGGSGVILSTAQASECILYTSIDGVTTELCGAESDAILAQAQAQAQAQAEEDISYDDTTVEAQPRWGVFDRIYSALGGRD